MNAEKLGSDVSGEEVLVCSVVVLMVAIEFQIYTSVQAYSGRQWLQPEARRQA